MTEPAVFDEARDLIRQGDRGAAVAKLMAAVPVLAVEFHRKAYSCAGLAFYFEGQYAEAISRFEIAARDSEVPEDWFNVAMSRLKIGDVQGAKEAWEQAFTLSYAHQDAPETSTFFQKKAMFARALLEAGTADELGLDLVERQLMGFFTHYHITDAHIWGMRGVPAFEEVVELTREYYHAMGKPLAEWEALCDRIGADVDDEGRQFLAGLRKRYGGEP